ncbi:MAG: NUMOD3 domain-containing DNA-binding protein, partial [Nitrososphaeraceae archaeon]|nr:NUMOD3 domain-containing DNA-binding protein [Nitrososphaeraceae archaeon]
ENNGMYNYGYTDEQILNMSGKNHHFYGKSHTKETKQKMRESRLGFKHSERTKEKIRQSHIGFKHSKETREKIKQIRLNKFKGRENYNFIGYYYTPFGKFESLEAAAKACNCSISTIRTRCRNPDKKIHPNTNIDKSFIGKTWKEAGYYFQPKEDQS